MRLLELLDVQQLENNIIMKTCVVYHLCSAKTGGWTTSSNPLWTKIIAIATIFQQVVIVNFSNFFIFFLDVIDSHLPLSLTAYCRGRDGRKIWWRFGCENRSFPYGKARMTLQDTGTIQTASLRSFSFILGQRTKPRSRRKITQWTWNLTQT